MEPAIAEIGHNQPPEDANPIGDRLTIDHGDLLKRRDELLEAIDRVPPCDGEEAAKKIGDYIKQLSACIKDANGRRVMEKEPYLDGGRNVDAFFKDVSEALETIKKQVGASLTIYQREKEAAERKMLDEKAEADKKAAEEAAELAKRTADNMASEQDLGQAMQREAAAEAAAAEAARAAKEAATSAADLSRTRSGKGGSVSSLRTTWEFESLDRDSLDLEKLRPYLAIPDLEKAVRAFIKSGGRELKGVRIYEDKKAVVR